MVSVIPVAKPAISVFIQNASNYGQIISNRPKVQSLVPFAELNS